MRRRRTWLLLFFILSGIIIGTLVASIAEGVPFLRWLAFGQSIGLDTAHPLLLDLGVVRIAFGFELGVNISQIIFILAAILLSSYFVKKI